MAMSAPENPPCLPPLSPLVDQGSGAGRPCQCVSLMIQDKETMKTLLCALGAHPLEECPQWIPIELISTNSLKHDQFATVLAVPLDKAEQRRAIRCLLSGRPVPLGRKEHIQRFLEYEMISLNFAPEVIDSFASWAKERTGSCPLSADTMHTLRESGTHSGVKNYSVSSEAHLSLVLR